MTTALRMALLASLCGKPFRSYRPSKFLTQQKKTTFFYVFFLFFDFFRFERQFLNANISENTCSMFLENFFSLITFSLRFQRFNRHVSSMLRSRDNRAQSQKRPSKIQLFFRYILYFVLLPYFSYHYAVECSKQ